MQIDGAGYEIGDLTAERAVKAFTELWCSGKFDCGPQDYEFMRDEILRVIKEGSKESK